MNYTKKQYVVFDNDDDFIKYAVNPEAVIMPLEGTDVYYFTFNFSEAYNHDTGNNLKFLMRDEKSSVMKRGCVSYRTVSLPVEVSSMRDAVALGYISEDDILK